MVSVARSLFPWRRAAPLSPARPASRLPLPRFPDRPVLFSKHTLSHGPEHCALPHPKYHAAAAPLPVRHYHRLPTATPVRAPRSPWNKPPLPSPIDARVPMTGH